MTSEHLVVLSTCPDRQVAEGIAQTLVEARHAACVNIVPGITSVYRWEGEIQQDAELLLVIKTTAGSYRGVEETIRQLHPAELPEVVALSMQGGLGDYLHWVALETRKDG
jgi:periplasmic divalent cation tolerance protein